MRPAMVIDLTRCTGCLSCVEACITENISRIGPNGEMVYPDNVASYARTRPKILEYESSVRRAFVQCLHCENAPCVKVCPTGASYVSPEGVVLVDAEKCIKCRLCIYACPYNVRTFYEGKLEGEPKHEHALKPRVPDKCTFCYHRKREDGRLWTPACVEACPFGARLFGDLDNPADPVAIIAKYGIATRPRPDLGTKPKLFITPLRGGIELIEYPVRREDQLVTYSTWASVKSSIVRPLFEAAAAAAVILGLIHMARERRRG
ncbi:MAG: 4Fe-4S dicluster domain-containing protein [Thermoproteota archaeon]